MESNEKLGVIDNNDKALELTEKGFKRVNDMDKRKTAAAVTFLIFVIIGFACLFTDFTGKNDGIFGFFAFICAWPAILVPAIIMGNTSWNKDWKESDWNEGDFESDHKYGKYYDGEDDPITGTDYAGSDGNIYD